MVDDAITPQKYWDKQLLQAVSDARYLLAYFSRVRVEIAPEKRDGFNQSIVTISRFIETTTEDGIERQGRRKTANGLPAKDLSAANFWKAFIFLSDIAYPATIESIRYYFHYYYSSKGPYSADRIEDNSHQESAGFLEAIYSLRRAMCGFFKGQKAFELITFIALVMTIGLSLLAYVGSTALAGYGRDYGHWLDVQSIAQVTVNGVPPNIQTEETTRDIILTVAAADPARSHQIRIPRERAERFMRLIPVSNETGDTRPADMTFSCKSIPDAEMQARCKVELVDVPPRIVAIADDLAFTLSGINSDRATLNTVLEVATFPLEIWDLIVLTPVRWVWHHVKDQDAGRDGAAQDASLKAAAGIRPPIMPDIGEPDPRTTGIRAFAVLMMIQKRGLPIPETLPPPFTNILSLTVSAQLAVSIINNYLLTLSFGFLGACVRVLRQITTGLENFTLAPSLFARYRARILLGMVAGPTIGLLFDSQGHLLSISGGGQPTAQVTTELSALAIAFVAGFSIEILFSLLDRLIRIVQEFAGGEIGRTSTTRT